MAKKKEKEVVETKAVTEEKVETAVEEVKAEEGEGEGTETVEKKEGFFKKTWKYIVTGVTCAAVGVGVTLGADTDKVLDTLTQAQAKQLAMTAAVYSAEQVLNKITAVSTTENKVQAIKEALVATQEAMPQFMEAVTAVKETAKEIKEDAVEIKNAVKGDATTPEQK